VNDVYEGRFEVFVFGGRNTLFSWSQMALVAPLDGVRGGLESLVLESGIDGVGGMGLGNGTQTVPPLEGGASKRLGSVESAVMMMGVALGTVVLTM
jgi:hexosaminidase